MRPWNIEEQSVEVEGTKWLLEFTSAHTEAVNSGEEAPGHDRHVVLRVWNETRNRYMLLEFDRGGLVKRTSVEAADPATAPGPGALVEDGTATGEDGSRPSMPPPATPLREWDEIESREGFASPAHF